MDLVCNIEYLQWKIVRHGIYGVAAVKQHLNDRPARDTTYFLFHKYLFQMPVTGNLLYYISRLRGRTEHLFQSLVRWNKALIIALF